MPTVHESKHTEKRAIPKFASFKPSAPSKSQSQETRPSENITRLPETCDDAQDESVSRSKRHNRTQDRYHPQFCHDHSLRTEANRHFGSESAGQAPGAGENLPPLFVVDRVGDPNNLHFGALHRYATASYFRFGAGNVVGSSANQRINRAVSTEKGLVLSDDIHDLPRKSDKPARWRPNSEGAREFMLKPREEHDPAIDLAADYVSLETARRTKRIRGDDDLHVDCVLSPDEDDTHYRSMQGKANPKKEPADRDLKYNSDPTSSQDVAGSRLLTLDDSAQKRQIKFSRRTDTEPTNHEAWIDLIHHQDEMLGLGRTFKRKGLTEAERRSNAEIKLSMFEKALEKVKDSKGREILLLGMMQEVTRVWGTHKVVSRWKKMLKQNPQSLRLWTKYLDFMQTSFTYFRFEEVKSVYFDCLNLIRETRTSGGISLGEQNQKFDIQIYVVLRMTQFMRESGFAEHATAAWQALLEFVFFRPVIVQTSDNNKDALSHDDSVSMFERFWDSEVPRIGEHGAEGWASFSQKQGEPPQPRTEMADDLEDTNDHWKSWLASERRLGLLARNPARTVDDTAENDPYRIILFSDIRPFLIDPPSLAGQHLVLDAFMVFCCLPPFTAEGPNCRSRVWRRDGFLCNEALRLGGKLIDPWRFHFSKQYGTSEEQMGIDDEEVRLLSGMQDPFQFPVRDYQVSSDSLFPEEQWFDVWQGKNFADGGPVEFAWVHRLLELLIGIGIGGEALALYVLALELRTSPGTVKQLAKKILRKRPCIRLYNAYALIEYRLEGFKKGESIIITSMNMNKKLDEVAQMDCSSSILLLRTLVWKTLTANSAREALMRLLAIGDEELQLNCPESRLPEDLDSAKPALLLRTEKALVAIRDRMLSLNSYEQAAFAIECLILFTYLRNAQSLFAANLAFKANIALLTTHVASNSSNHEYLHQSFARLLYYHATHTRLFKPSDIRSLLAESIAQFPQNSIFLSLYAWNEVRFRIDDRVRSVVKELVLRGSVDVKSKAEDSVMPHVFAIYSELHRGITLGSNLSTIRSTFERAVQSDSGARCAGLWKLYFLFERSRSEMERAMTVFWRGLRACPWAKDLYMLAFEHLRGQKAMSEADLRGIYELLGEKELRVHVGLDDIFEKAQT